MICPKCEEGTIKKVSFKSKKEIAYICEFCNSMWFEKERIGFDIGSIFSAISTERDTEYSIDDLDEKDQDHRSAAFVTYK